jgi:hypothetical protein
MAPARLIRPILLPPVSVNQMLPSAPAVIAKGVLFAVGIENSVTLGLGISSLLLMPRYMAR